MKTGSTKYAMLFLALCSITARRGMTQSVQDYLPGIQSVLPESWTCRISGLSDSMIWPEGLNKPLFTASFVDTVHMITDCTSHQSNHPGLTICFYAEYFRETIEAVIEQQAIYSWCIPIKYLESPGYFIVTSPCY